MSKIRSLIEYFISSDNIIVLDWHFNKKNLSLAGFDALIDDLVVAYFFGPPWVFLL